MKFNIICGDKKKLSLLKGHLLSKYEALDLGFFSKFEEASRYDGYYYSVGVASINSFDAVVSTEAEFNLQCLDDILSGYQTLLNILHSLDKGTIAVQFGEYCFGGGRDDRHVFRMKQNGKFIGEISFLNQQEIEFNLPDIDQSFYERTSESRITPACKLCEKVIKKALRRDDAKYVAAVAKYSNNKKDILVPVCYENISREEVLNAESTGRFASDAFVPLV